MRNGVVIGCVGVVAAAAVAIVVYAQPSPAVASDLVVKSKQPSASTASDAAAKLKGAQKSTAPTKAAPPAAKPAARPRPEVAAAQETILPAAYRILLTRSIFSPNGVGGKKSVKSSEPVFTLRGVAQRRRGFIAYIENSASGEYRTVRVGDSIGDKKVIKIELHSVEFIEGKRATKIAVGQTLGSSAGSPSALATAQPQLD